MPVKGRSSQLIARRNEALLRRYYYLTEVQRLRFDDTYRQLSLDEFFISEDRIRDIINQNLDMLERIDKEYKKENPPAGPAVGIRKTLRKAI